VIVLDSIKQLPVTVIVPLYNKETGISRALHSILRQTVRPFEVVVVDDQSTDRSVEMVYEVANRSNIPIRLIRNEKNLGAGATRNVGWRHAETPWVAFLDADDYWQSEFLSTVWSEIQEQGAILGASGMVIRDLRGERPTQTTCLLDRRTEMDPDRYFLRASMKFYPINSSCNLVNKAALARIGGFPEDVRRYEDVITWMRLWGEGRFAFVNQPLTVYERIPGGITSESWDNKAAFKFVARLVPIVVKVIVRRRRGATHAPVFLAWISTLVFLTYLKRLWTK
jgi:glycosyltransferase involved in cell wall biosynthesis